jgi:hypothetical protein
LHKSLLQIDPYFQSFSGVLSLFIVSSLHLIYLNHFINHLISFHTISRIQSNHVPLINYNVWLEGQVSITEEQRRFKPIKTQLEIPNYTTYVGPGPTYINPHLDPPKQKRVHATQEHSTPPPYPILVGWVHATLAISPLPMRGCPFS